MAVVIYVDTLFLLNALVDYLLLLGAARLAGEPLRRLQFGAGAALGGLYAVALFLPGMGFLNHPLCRVAAGVLMVLAAYGGSRRLLRQGLIFLALTTYFYFTGTMLGNLAPLLTVPGLVGLGVLVIVSRVTTGSPSRTAAIVLALACFCLAAFTLPIGILGLLSNFGG